MVQHNKIEDEIIKDILFDTIPGGARNDKMINEPKTFEWILKGTLSNMEGHTCGG